MQATAIIVGSDEDCAQGLMDLSLDIGFRMTLNFTNIAAAEQQAQRTPICFFLFSMECRKKNIPSIAKAIRMSRNRQIKFAPLVGFTEHADAKIIEFCLNIGFDDILVPPFSAKKVLPRLNGLLDRRITFFETVNYFGPDRRDRPGIDRLQSLHPGRGKGGDHRRIVISRNMDTGINILKDQFHRQNGQVALERANSLSV